MFRYLIGIIGLLAQSLAVAEAPVPRPLMIGAASSLEAVLRELIPLYAKQAQKPEAKLTLAASGTLRQQISQGAPIDLFLSADKQPVSELSSQGLILDDTRTALASNQLLMIRRRSQTVPSGQLTPPSQTLLAAKRIAIGDPLLVPAGRYAMDVIRSELRPAQLQERLILAHHVEQVRQFVETGAVDLGFIYASDAADRPNIEVVWRIPPDRHQAIVYVGAVVRRSAEPEAARRFLKFLTSKAAQSVFSRHDFLPPAPGAG